MDVLDIFLKKYSYKFPKGYPDMNNEQDILIMEGILSELDINEEETPEEIKISKDIIDNKTFEEYVLEKYIMGGQEINGLNELYEGILKSPEKDKLLDIVKNSGKKPLKSGKIPIKDIDSILFNLIMSYIKLSNGDPSDLWFAIMFDGKAKGGVASETGIESDVDVDGKGVSIKNYKTLSSLDFGSLPSEELKQFKKIINLFSILTDIELTAGLTRNSLNKLFQTLNSESFQNDLKQILNIGKDTEIKSLKNIYNSIITLLPNGNTEELVNNFINKINELIEKKIKSVDWWAIIAGKNDMYLEQSSVLTDKIKSKEDQLSPIISQIKGNNLFVNGNLLFKME